MLVELKEAGVDTIGIHIESFDFNILTEIAPAKSALGLKRYSKAWEKSVEIFGINQVSSFLIAGLGESRKSIIDGSIYLAERGVYPFLVPLRPIPGSLLQNASPPPPEFMIELYEEVSQILTKSNISSKKNKAGCVRCGACSALPEFEL
jgi:radical SAM protein (TIGR04043 family)